MLARVQWQASRQRLPYVCPACHQLAARRHYSLPREDLPNSDANDALSLDVPTLSKSRPNSRKLGAVLKEADRLSQLLVDDKSDKAPLKDQGEEKAKQGNDTTSKRQISQTLKRLRFRQERNENLRTGPINNYVPADIQQPSLDATKPILSKTGVNETGTPVQSTGTGKKENSESPRVLWEPSPNSISELASASDGTVAKPAHEDQALASSSTMQERRRRARRRGMAKFLRFVLSMGHEKSTQGPVNRRIAAQELHFKNLQLREWRRRASASRSRPSSSLESAVDAPVSRDTSATTVPSQQQVKSRKKRKELDKEASQSRIKVVVGSHIHVSPLEIPSTSVPGLSHGLDRVLFNPGVYHLQDPRSRVYNFDPYLEKIMPAVEFDFSALSQYMISSEDTTLQQAAADAGVKYFSSTSSVTNILKHFHYLISQWRELTFSMLSKGFEAQGTNFTAIQQSPSSVFLRYQNGRYAIDGDKSHDTGSVLSLVGKSLEKLFTLPKDDFERYRKSKPGDLPKEMSSDDQAFHYTVLDKILVRSQLDAYDSRLPGSGMFDIKTRAVLPVRMDKGSRGGVLRSYQIKERLGTFESFEREYFDMIRATMLKYSLQVRLGRMDGLFVAYHNIERIFGFQYVSLEDMDLSLHGQTDPTLGDQELNASMKILGSVLDHVAQRFPEQSVRLHFETRSKAVPFMYIFAEPMSEENIQQLQDAARKRVEEMENAITNPDPSQDVPPTENLDLNNDWSDLKILVREEVNTDDFEQEIRQDVGSQLPVHEVMANLEEQVAHLSSSVQRLRTKSSLLAADIKRENDIDTSQRSELSGLEKENQVLEVIQETEKLDKELNHLKSTYFMPRLEDKDSRRRLDDLQDLLKEIESQLHLQMAENGRMVSNIQPRIAKDAAEGNREGGDDAVQALSAHRQDATGDSGTSEAVIDSGSHEVPPTFVECRDKQIPDSNPTPSVQYAEESQNNSDGTTAPQQSTSVPWSSEQSPASTLRELGESGDPEGQVEGGMAEENSDQDNGEPRELLAFTLSVRNRVNGRYVTRPENITRNDDWAIEYNLEPIENDEHARRRYRESKRRQDSQLQTDEARIESWYGGYFMRLLFDLSEKGRRWREKMDKVDEKVGIRVFVPNEERSNGVKNNQNVALNTKVGQPVEGVDGYMDWLYKTR